MQNNCKYLFRHQKRKMSDYVEFRMFLVSLFIRFMQYYNLTVSNKSSVHRLDNQAQYIQQLFLYPLFWPNQLQKSPTQITYEQVFG